MHDPIPAKRELRRRMRRVRLAVPDRPARSAWIASRLDALPAVRDATVLMLYDAVDGEPDLSSFAAAVRAGGRQVVAPEPSSTADEPLDPALADVVVVPGLAFTERGDRLGQGGGWYDRFLARCSPDCEIIGVCFDVQVVDELPAAPHDIPMTAVVTERRVVTLR